MTYDPKKRPAWLVPEHLRTSPDRLKTGVMHVADQNENKVEVVPREGTLEKLMKGGKIIALVLSTLAGGALALEGAGIQLPPALKAVCLAVLGIAASLGIASKGIDRNGDGVIDEKDEEPPLK